MPNATWAPRPARKAVRTASTKWKLLSVTMQERGVIPSGAEQYLMQFKGGTPVFVTLSDLGLPLTVNVDENPIETEAPELPVARPLSASPL